MSLLEIKNLSFTYGVGTAFEKEAVKQRQLRQIKSKTIIK